MEAEQVMILLIILLLAIPFGYFLHKAINSVATKNLLEQLKQLKLIDSQRQALIVQLKTENAEKAAATDKLQQEYFQLTLASKDLKDKELALEKKLLEKQYDIPPDYPHLQESNALLQKEIQRTRAKIKKWKAKDYIKANKKLVKKVKSLKNRVVALRDENTKFEKSHAVLSQIRELTETINPVRSKEIFPSAVEENPFAHQPEFSKKAIFKDIFPSKTEEKPAPVIDLQEKTRSLNDLAGMDKESIKILKKHGIHNFNDLVQQKIKHLASIFGENPKSYPFETWPIQARLAIRGEWTRKNGPPIHSISKIPIPRFNSFHLDNGIPVFFIREGSQELVKLDIVFKGGRHREQAKTLSRIFSGVIKEGTKNDSAEELSSYFDTYGASYNSRSSLDFTTFTLLSLTKFFPLLIEKFTEIILDPAFDSLEVEKFIENNCRKLDLDKSKNEIVAYRMMTEKLFGSGAVYGYNSTKESYRKINQSILKSYHKDMLEEQECFVFLCGQYDSKIEHAINSAFGQWNYQGKGKMAYAKSDVQGVGRFSYPSVQEHQSALRVGRLFGNRKDPAYAKMTFLNNVLGGFFGSRLMKNIREEKGYTYNVFSSLDTMLYEGYFYISTEVSPKHTEATISEIYKEMETLRNTEVSKNELEMNRNYMLGNLLTAVDGPFQSIRLIKSAILNGDSREDLERTIDTFLSITSREIQETAEKFLKPSEFIEVIIG